MTLFTAAILGAIIAYGATKSARRKRERQAQAALPPAVGIPDLPVPAHPVLTLPVVGQALVVAADCSVWEVLDPSRFALEIRFIYYGERLRGLVDPYMLADSVMAYVAPTCRGRGDQIRNLGELDLYAQLFVTVAELMFHEGLLDEELWIVAAEDFDVWYTQEAQALSMAA